MSADEQNRFELTVRGLHCAGCVARLTRLLERVPGVEKAEVSLLAGNAKIVGHPDRAAVVQAIENAGFYT